MITSKSSMYVHTYSMVHIKLVIFFWKRSGAPEIPMGRQRYKYLLQGRIIVHIFWASGSKFMVWYPMFKSIAVADVNPSISGKVELILGIGKGVRTMRLFTSLKLVRNFTIWFNVGIINSGESNSYSGCLKLLFHTVALLFFIKDSLLTLEN